MRSIHERDFEFTPRAALVQVFFTQAAAGSGSPGAAAVGAIKNATHGPSIFIPINCLRCKLPIEGNPSRAVGADQVGRIAGTQAVADLEVPAAHHDLLTREAGGYVHPSASTSLLVVVAWRTPEGQAAIAGYKINGQQLFYPNANDPNA